jgi:hypothetical protein
MFEKLRSAKLVFYLLQKCANKPVTTVGAFDLPEIWPVIY